MIDLVWLTAASNLLFAGLLAVAALVCSRFQSYTRLAHVLWVLVLVKLVTPPLLNVTPTAETTAMVNAETPLNLSPRPVPAEAIPFNEPPAHARSNTIAPRPSAVAAPAPLISLPQLWQWAKYPATLVWCAGSLVILLYSICRMRQFAHLLAESEIAATPGVQNLVAELAKQMKVARRPKLRMTTAQVSPMVLPSLRRPTLVVPYSLTQKLTDQQLRLVLAHELGHLRRGDHFVRLLEWFSWLVMWWNPLIWFAQRQLRECEEQSCDLFVLTTLKARSKHYAVAILEAVEAISPPVVRPPVMASAMNSGGTLERRMRKMLGTKKYTAGSWWKRLLVVAIATLILPLGIVSAADYQKVYERLMESVSNGDLTEEQADLMMTALKKSEGDQLEDFDEEDLDQIGEKLKQMVADGQLTEEEAWKKWKYLRRKANGLDVAELEEDHDEHFDEEEHEEEGFEEDGFGEDEFAEDEFEEDEGIEEEEDEEWNEDEEDRERAYHQLEGIELRLRLAVHEGEMSEEEAHRKYDEALEELGLHEEDDHEHGHEDDEEWEDEEEREIEFEDLGDLSEEEVRERFEQALEAVERQDALDELRAHIVESIREGIVSPEQLEEEWDDILEEAEEDEEEWEDQDEDDEDWEDEEDDDFDDEDEFEDDEEEEGEDD